MQRCLLLMYGCMLQPFQIISKIAAAHHTSSCMLPLWLQAEQTIGAEAFLHYAAPKLLCNPSPFSIGSSPLLFPVSLPRSSRRGIPAPVPLSATRRPSQPSKEHFTLLCWS